MGNLDLSLREQLIVSSPALSGYVAGMISFFAGGMYAGENGLLYMLPFLGVSLICFGLGAKISREWYQNLEEVGYSEK